MADEKKQAPPAFPKELFEPVEPFQIFDELYFVGDHIEGNWIIDTSEGLVLIEGTGNPDALNVFLRPGLKKLGLEGKPVIALLLTHGHFDHYAGAGKIQKETGCKIALSTVDTAYMTFGVENAQNNHGFELPVVNIFLDHEQDLTFGDKTIHVIPAPGHTPGCLNYSMEVHDHGVPHRFVMMGGYGVFGPGANMNQEYTYGTVWAIDQAFKFASSCAALWEYAKANNADVFFNPHPHLCRLLENAEKAKSRKEGEPSPYVNGLEGVRKWILDRYDVCIKGAESFTDIRKELK